MWKYSQCRIQSIVSTDKLSIIWQFAAHLRNKESSWKLADVKPGPNTLHNINKLTGKQMTRTKNREFGLTLEKSLRNHLSLNSIPLRLKMIDC